MQTHVLPTCGARGPLPGTPFSPGQWTHAGTLPCVSMDWSVGQGFFSCFLVFLLFWGFFLRPSQHIRKTCSYEIQPTSLSAAQAIHAHVWPLSSRAGGDVTGLIVSPLTHVVPLHLGTLEMRKQAGILFMEGAPGILLRERGGDLRAFPQDICPSFPLSLIHI